MKLHILFQLKRCLQTLNRYEMVYKSSFGTVLNSAPSCHLPSPMTVSNILNILGIFL